MIRLETLELAGYQQLSGAFAFGPTLTVVTGANEAGKSTLHEALSNMMFGFSPDDRRKHQGVSEKDLRRPWSGASFGGTLIVSVGDRRFRIHWDFASDHVTVFDAVTGTTESQQTLSQRQDASVGPDIFGIARERHRQLSCLFQEDLRPVEAGDGLQQALQRAVEQAGSPELGVVDADAILRGFLGDLGVHSGHYNASPGGRLATLRTTRDELKASLVLAETGRAELDRLAARAATARDELRSMDGLIEADRQAGLRAAAERAAERSATVAELQKAGVSAAADEPHHLPSDLPGRVEAARDAVEAKREALAAAEAAGHLAQQQLAAAREEVTTARAQREALKAYQSMDLEHEGRVRELLAEFRASEAALKSVTAVPEGELGSPGLAGLSPGAGRQRTAVVPYTVAGGVAIAGVAAGVALHPGAFSLVVVAVLIALFGSRRASRSETTDVSGAANSAGELARRAAASERERVVTEVRSQVDAAAARLGALVSETSSSESLEVQAIAYLDKCQKRKAFDAAEAALDKATAAEASAAAPEHQIRESQSALADANRDLLRLLHQLGIDEEDVDAGVEQFHRRVAEDSERRQDAERRALQEGRLSELLNGQSASEVSDIADEAKRVLERHIASHGVLTAGSPAPEAVEHRAAHRSVLNDELVVLGTQRSEREAGLADPADLSLQLKAAELEIGSIEMRATAARIAREALKEAAQATHRRVAPFLNRALADALPRVTRGRYREAMVSDDLSIRLIGPETGVPVAIERLSRGTRDQIALVERLELARILDPTGGEAPLLLDDCFAHTDRHRLVAGIELLIETSQRRQVVLFTDDPAVVEAASGASGNVAILELIDPANAGPSAGAEKHSPTGPIPTAEAGTR